MPDDSCFHRAQGAQCPISQTPCMGECVYADILADISLGIIGLDIEREEVFFQNKLAVEIFKSTTRPKDYRGLAALLLPEPGELLTGARSTPQKMLRYGTRFLGFTIYRISETRLWIYVSDITEKMRLNAIAEAVSTMNNLGYIFSGIRHELGNPVNSIKTTATVLKQNIDGYSKQTVLQYVDRMLSDLTRVEGLLRDLKNFSLYETLEVTDVELQAFMDHLVAMSRPDFDREHIRIRTILRPEADRVRADPRALQQVMLNLLTNAADALRDPPDAEIVISAQRLDGRVIVKVRDNGCDPRRAAQVPLHPLFHDQDERDRARPGHHPKMIAKMGGTVEVESTEGVGTTVTLNLPRGAGAGA